MSTFETGGQAQRSFAQTDMYNQHYNQNSDTELINMAHEVHLVQNKTRPFDWFICSVLGYLCFPCTGICAIYYAVRANHGVDWEKDPELVSDHTRKAKCLSLTSIIIGTVLSIIHVILVIVIFVTMNKAVESADSTISSAESSNGIHGSMNLNYHN